MADPVDIVDPSVLINLVEKQPALWDKTHDHYRSRIYTPIAWREVMTALKPDYNDVDEQAKAVFGRHVIQKWTQIRDSFHKYLKKVHDEKLGLTQKKTKPYIFSNKLTFLIGSMKYNDLDSPDGFEDYKLEDYEADDSSTVEYTEDNSEDGIQHSTPKRLPPKTVNGDSNSGRVKSQDKLQTTPKRPATESSNEDPYAGKMMKLLDTLVQEDSRANNRHLSFYEGIIPTLDTLDEDEVLEFQIGVLQVLKNIRSKKAEGNPGPSQ